MHFNTIGQLLPEIDWNKCVDCGVCLKACPSYDSQHIISDTYGLSCGIIGNVKCIEIGRSTNDDIYKNGQSGGIVTAILSQLLNNGTIEAAVVCKICHADTYTSSATIVTNSKELFDCQKSSYTPIDMLSALKHTSQFRSIAIVGTGCHVQGVRMLQTLFPKKHDNVKVVIGLICDRVLAKTASDVLIGKNFRNERKKIIWRDKRQNYKNAKLVVKSETGKEIFIPSWKRHQLKDYFTPPRCLICFDKLNLGADIVVGDPWGMSGVDWSHGNSVVITRTEAGESVMHSIKENKAVVLHDASLNEFLRGQNIAGKATRLNEALLTYKTMGWDLPTYANDLMSDTIHLTPPLIAKQISRFVDDARKTKKAIISKYNRKLALTSLKMKIYNWIHPNRK